MAHILLPTAPAAPTVKRPRGRPPKLGGPLPPATVSRAYRTRIAAERRIARMGNPPPAGSPPFDPATHLVIARQTLVRLRDALAEDNVVIARQNAALRQADSEITGLKTALQRSETLHAQAADDAIRARRRAAWRSG